MIYDNRHNRNYDNHYRDERLPQLSLYPWPVGQDKAKKGDTTKENVIENIGTLRSWE